MADIKRPQDHKNKSTEFEFIGADGATHRLPFASKGAEKLTGRDTRDALMGGETGELKLGFIMLEACGADPAAVDALLDLPNEACLTKLGEWMQHGDGVEATVPQS